MQSLYFENLVNRIKVLKRSFLPRTLSPTGNYTSSTFEKTRAFKALTHAELEFYFEQIALAIAKKAYNSWIDKEIATIPVIALVAYYSGSYKSIPDSKSGNGAGENLRQRIHMAYTDYVRLINTKNHGIKEKNILHLLLPIGIDQESISDDLLLVLNNYGSDRGNIVHSTNRANQLLTPDDAIKEVAGLMSLIIELDQCLLRFL